MKVLVLFLLFAFCYAKRVPGESKPYCCGKDYKDEPSLEENTTCTTLKELVENKILGFTEATEQIPHIEMTPELKSEIKVKAISKAITECVPDDRLYRNVRKSFEKVHKILANYPTPRNLMKQFSEIQAAMEESFENLQQAKMSVDRSSKPGVDQRVYTFYTKFTEKAVEVFNAYLNQSIFIRAVFDNVPESKFINRIVDGLDECLRIEPTAFDRIFQCRRKVRQMVTDFEDDIVDLCFSGRLKLVPPEDSIEMLMMNFTAEAKVLQWDIEYNKTAGNFYPLYVPFSI